MNVFTTIKQLGIIADKFRSITFFSFFFFSLLVSTQTDAQSLDISSCPTMVKRSNGNGQAGSAAGDFRPHSTQNNPVAPNVTGTSYQFVPFLPTTKTGDIHLKWTSASPLSSIPVITRVWLTAAGSTSATLSNIKFGPPTVAVPSAPNYYIDYCFYNNNMPNRGSVTLEFSNPQTGTPAFVCTYDLGSNASTTTPSLNCTPIITTQPTNQVLCGATTANFSVIASGATGYQWQVSGDGITYSNIINGGVYAGATTDNLIITTPNINNGKFYRVVLSASGCPTATSNAAKLISNPVPTAVFSGATNYCGIGSRSLAIAFTGTAPYSVTYSVAGTAVTVNNISSSPYYIAVSPSVTTPVTISSVTDAYCTNDAPSGNTSIIINALPTIAPANANACLGSSSFLLPFTSTGSVNRYSITAGTRAMPGFVPVSNATLAVSPLSVTIPSSGVAMGTYDFLMSVNSSVTGCASTTVPFTVTVNNLPVVSASSLTNNVCAASPVTLLAAPANLSGYSWTSNPASTINSVYNPTVNPTATTTYTVLGTDANGCQATGNVTVTVQTGPSLSITPASPNICSGTSTSLTASGGAAYTWSPSNGLSATSGATVIASPTTTTTYTVVSQNTSGCASTGTVTVTVSAPTISITNSSPTVCAGFVSTLTATAGFSTYSWYPVTGLYTNAAATIAYTGTSLATVYAKPTSNTTYTVIGTTAANCMTSNTSAVTVSAAPVDVANSVGNSFTFCTTGTSSFSFAVNLLTTVTSMTWSYSTTQAGPYTSFAGAVSPAGATFTPTSTGSMNSTLTTSWPNGSYSGPRFLRLVIVSSTCTYNYDVQLFDTKGSGASLPSPVAAMTTICSGNSTTLSMGTINTTLTLIWQTSTNNSTFTNISGATNGTYTTPALSGTTYYRGAISGQGSCGYTTGSATITVGAAITGNTVSAGSPCTNGSTFILLSGSAISGGIYQWQRSTTSGTTGFSDIVGATSQNFTMTRNLVGVTTWFRRNVSTSTCTSNSSSAVPIFAPVTNNVISIAAATSYCAAAPALALNGLLPTGGDGSYVYQWQSSTDNSTYTDIAGATSQDYSTTIRSVTTYYKRKVTSGGCALSISDALIIVVNANPTVTVSPTSSSICGGNTVTITASGATSYSWSPATELSTTTGSSTIATITANRTYTVTGTNSFGCTSTASSVLTYTAPPATPTVSSSNVTVCSLPYNLTTLVTSGVGTEWYRAPVASATYLVGTPSAVNSAGTYYVFSKSGSCYSANFASVVLTLSDVSAPVLNSSSLVLCSPATANLASLEPTAASGTTLEWHLGSTSASTLVASPNSAGSGTYYLFAYSTLGNCYGPAAAATVTINALPVATVSVSPAGVCQPATIDLNTHNNTGNGSYSYQWYNVASSPSPSTLISSPNAVSTTGSYYLYATSASGCKGMASSAVNITVNPLPTALITPPSTVCAAASITVPASSNATSPVYTWQISSDAGSSYATISNGGIYSGATSANLSISNSTGLDGTFYRYTIAGSNGCNNISENVVVSVDGIASINTQPSNYSATVNGSALFRISTTGSPTVNYQWYVSTNGGTNYAVITDGIIYQGTTTPDLVISTASASFNGYKYRCDISNNCTSTTSSTAATLSVSSCTTASVGGTIAGNNAVCTGSNNSTLTLTGHTGTVLYWEYSTNNFLTEGLVVNNTASTLVLADLTTTTQYRAIVQSGSCATAISAIATVSVSPPSVGGLVAGAATVCAGTNSTTLTLSGHTGTVVKWQSSTNGFASSTDIANITTMLTATNLTVNTQYRAVVQSGSCATAISVSAAIIVNANGQWIGGTNGDWNNAANWCGGVPTTPAIVSIPSGSVVTITEANSYATQVNIAAGGSLIMNGSGNLIISSGGSFINNGTFNASASTTGKVVFAGSGVVEGTVLFKHIETNGAIDFGTSSTISGEFTLQPGGSVTGHSPVYECPGSTLIYRTSNIFVRGLEWTSAMSGAGYPSNVYIQNNTAVNFPIVGPGYVCNDLIIDNGSALNQNFSGGSAPLTVARDVIVSGNLALGAAEGGDISLGRNWTRLASGIFTHNSRTVNFLGSTNSVITAPVLTTSRNANGAFGGETFYKLAINKATANTSVTLGAHISIEKALQITQGAFNLSNSDVTLVSKNDNTAAVSTLPTAGGILSGVSINYTGTGKFVVQRHLLIGTGSASRRWRVLTAPLQSTDAPTISQAWQNGVSNVDRAAPADPWPGFGTTITKSTTYNAGDGYDQGSTNNPSIYAISNASPLYAVMSSTKIPITNYEAYMLFARGNRSIVVSTPSINATETILEPRGRLNTGNVQKNLTSGFQVFGNPYASSIDFNKIVLNGYTQNGTTFNNVTPGSLAGTGLTYYLWDPKTSGSSNVGKWITLSSNGDGTYTATANTSEINTMGLIQSSAAFAVAADTSGGTLTFHEADKVVSSTSVGLASRGDGTSEVFSRLTTNLLVSNAQGTILSDGVVTTFHSAYRNQVDGQDARKLSSFNSGESIAIERGGKKLAIERRQRISTNDTIFLGLTGLNKVSYKLQFYASNFDAATMAFVEDAYTASSTPISLSDTTYLAFNVTADPNSFAANRFKIVFKTAGVLPITLNSITATKQAGDVAVNWSVNNEEGYKTYVVERSGNGRNFTPVNTQKVQINGLSSNTYNWLDQQTLAGDNYYRIGMMALNGSVQYSKVVRVNMASGTTGVQVFPNPVRDGKINLQFSNRIAGNIHCVLVNSKGQNVFESNSFYQGNGSMLTLKTPANLANGTYYLQMQTGNGERELVQVFLQK